MRPTAGFLAAVGASAIAFVLIENAFWGFLPFGFAVALSSVLALPAVLVGGVPVWLVFRRCGIRSALAFACAGATLALLTGLLLLGLGFAHGFFEPPEPFLQAITSPYPIRQLLAAAVSGAVGAIVFWLIEVRRQRNSPAVATPW